MLPGLKLDRLTVFGTKEPGLSYETLNMLVRYSDGWKELHYLTHDSKLLGHRYYTDPFDHDVSDVSDDSDDFDPLLNLRLRQPQPSDWQNAIEQRDGQASHPSVVVHRERFQAPFGQEIFTQAFADDQDMETFGKVKDDALMRDGEVQKEMLIVVKRGAGVEYAQKGQSPRCTVGDIRWDHPDLTWKNINTQMNIAWDCRCYDSDTDEETGSEIVDEYSHVDDYA